MPKTYQELLRKIELGAGDVRSTGDQLTSRIKAFESWLGKLPGRLPAECILKDEDDEEFATFLSLIKEGKSWTLYVITYFLPDGSVTNRIPLRDAAIQTKVLAIETFPQLLEALAERQRNLVDCGQKSISKFDAFATEIGLEEGA